jgi:dephospho-CoA kinase
MRLNGGVLMVGLTGGIASGKSAVSSRLAELGAIIIDADQLARDVVRAGTDGLAEIVAEFGPTVIGADGELDRPRLAEIVFADPSARERLEKIIHPRVRARTATLAAAAPEDAIVVNDVPLLIETGLAGSYPVVIVVLAPVELRIERLLRDRRMTEAQARARIEAQATDDQRRAAADYVIENDGTLADLRAKVDAVWHQLR